MITRRGEFKDIGPLIELIQDGHRISKYKDVEMDTPYLKQMLSACIQRQEVKGENGCCVIVGQDHNPVDGVLIGMVERIYHIGKKFAATDLFFFVRPDASSKLGLLLFRQFEKWAEARPEVAYIKLGVTDIFGDIERMSAFYERRGYSRSGLMFERKLS